MNLRSAVLDGYRLSNPEAQFVVDLPAWCGHPRWGCNQCTFSTTSEKIQTVFVHVRNAHPELLIGFDEPKKKTRIETIQTSLVSPTGDQLAFEREEH